MATTKPQKIDPKQVKQFLSDAQKKTVAARKNLVIDEETKVTFNYRTEVGKTKR